ncbi:hypothetical protein [Thauera aminoaromatica]|uniref:hypothetical protein n=1 Tax=Thauera aminoaromatica TaxID=164330 RepID=UPI0035B461A2
MNSESQLRKELEEAQRELLEVYLQALDHAPAVAAEMRSQVFNVTWEAACLTGLLERSEPTC